jgi:hypothetical protein
MGETQFPAGHVFFRPGDPGDRAYLVREGRVEAFAGPPEAPARVAVFGPGDVFGEMSLVEERPHALTARALTAVQADALTRNEFERDLLQNPVRCRQYLVTLFERLRTLASQAAPDAGITDPTLPAAPAAQPPRPATLPAADPTDPPPARRVVLYPLTRRAAGTLPEDGLLLNKFPMRIGRVASPDESEGFQLNDLWLIDEKPYQVSRTHCAIELGPRGNVVVSDRGSNLGMLVNDTPVGGRAAARTAVLHPGQNVLVLGTRMSPYQFRVTVDDA